MNITYGPTVTKALNNFKLTENKLLELEIKFPEYCFKVIDGTIHFYKKIKGWWRVLDKECTSLMYDPSDNCISTSYWEMEEATRIAEIIDCDVFVYCIGKCNASN